MTRAVPIVPTIIVGVAIAVMIALGFWQLGRMDEKEALIAQARQSLNLPGEVEYPRTEAGLEERMYRRTRIACGFSSSRRWTSSRTCSCSHRVMRRCFPVVQRF